MNGNAVGLLDFHRPPDQFLNCRRELCAWRGWKMIIFSRALQAVLRNHSTGKSEKKIRNYHYTVSRPQNNLHTDIYFNKVNNSILPLVF